MRSLLVLLALLLPLTGCALFDPAETDLTFAGTVTYTQIEGGAWLIESDEGDTYHPVHLSEAFKHAGLRVRVRAEVLKDHGSFIMVGTMIEVKQIERL